MKTRHCPCNNKSWNSMRLFNLGDNISVTSKSMTCSLPQNKKNHRPARNFHESCNLQLHEMRYEKRTNMGLKLSLRQGMHIQTHPPFVVAFTRWHSRMNACTRTCCRPVPLTNRFSRKRHSQWNVRCRRSVFQRIDCGRIFAKPKRDVLRPWSSNANNATNGKATLP